ncbi:unnamed protein product [Bursaphelenchus xylophilus]|uniref:(pine wood nematode) hypothetical protein n=1 Tax=Bursaphelenchus xylophilus TaxID=6326 RepID=A0A1I7S279_BURXY|nr:unnamed protein product [Bursaphelenchus xylophilus]CAG9114826.1 unnamed protein product [Bursaphelenchus xylophilus]
MQTETAVKTDRPHSKERSDPNERRSRVLGPLSKERAAAGYWSLGGRPPIPPRMALEERGVTAAAARSLLFFATILHHPRSCPIQLAASNFHRPFVFGGRCSFPRIKTRNLAVIFMTDAPGEALISEADPPPYESTTKHEDAPVIVSVDENDRNKGKEDESDYLDPPYKTNVLHVPLMVWIRILAVSNFFIYLTFFLPWMTNHFKHRNLYEDHKLSPYSSMTTPKYHLIGIYPFVFVIYSAIVFGWSHTFIKFKQIPPWRSIFNDAENIPFYIFTSLSMVIIWSIIFLDCYFSIFLMSIYAVICYVLYSMAACYLATGYCWFSRSRGPKKPANSEFFYWHRLFVPKQGKTVAEKFKLILAVNLLVPSGIFLIGQIVYWTNLDEPGLVFVWLYIAVLRLGELKFFIGGKKKGYSYVMLAICLVSFAVSIFFYLAANYNGKYGGGVFLVTSIVSCPLAILDIWFFVKYKDSNSQGDSNIAELLFK